MYKVSVFSLLYVCVYKAICVLVVSGFCVEVWICVEMAPSFDFSNRWMKETQKSTPVVVTMENPTFSVVEINGVDAAFRPVEKTRSKNAKQVTWFLFLKAYHAIGCVTWFATVLWSLMGAIRKRLIDREGVTLESEKMEKGKVLFTVIKVFLVSSLVVLVFEVVAYLQGWHFGNPSLHIPRAADLEGLMHLVYVAWLRFRGEYIAPPMQALSKFCIVLFLIQSVDRMVLCFGCFWIKYKRIKPKIDRDAGGCWGSGFGFYTQSWRWLRIHWSLGIDIVLTKKGINPSRKLL